MYNRKDLVVTEAKQIDTITKYRLIKLPLPDYEQPKTL